MTHILEINATLLERARIYKRLEEMKSVYETMDTGSALKQLKEADNI